MQYNKLLVQQAHSVQPITIPATPSAIRSPALTVFFFFPTPQSMLLPSVVTTLAFALKCVSSMLVDAVRFLMDSLRPALLGWWVVMFRLKLGERGISPLGAWLETVGNEANSLSIWRKCEWEMAVLDCREIICGLYESR
jgi:hypothetical protein